MSLSILVTEAVAQITPALTNLALIPISPTAFTATVDSNVSDGTIYVVDQASAIRPSNAAFQGGSTASPTVGVVALPNGDNETPGSTVWRHVALNVGNDWYYASASVTLPAQQSSEDFGNTLSSNSIGLLEGRQTTGATGPAGFIFEINITSSAPRCQMEWHDVETFWEVLGWNGEYDALSSTMPWGRQKRFAYGPAATFVLPPGTWTIRAISYDGTSRLTTETVVTVNDPDVVFAGADTAVVSQNSDFTGAPSGAAQFDNISAALSHIQGRTNGRLLLRRGETFTEEIRLQISGGSAGKKRMVGAFGSGDRPHLSLTNDDDGVRWSVDEIDEAIVDGLRITSNYDPTAISQPVANRSDAIDFHFAGRLTQKTVHDCRIGGVNTGVRLEGGVAFTTPKRAFYISNTRIIGWMDYAIFGGDGAGWALSGCTIQQPRGTRNGFLKNSFPYWADHGPFRISRAYGTVVMSNCDIATFNSWAAQSHTRSFQPYGRWNTGNGRDENGDFEVPRLVHDRIRGEGGGLRFHNPVGNDTGGGPPSTRRPAMVVADRIFHIMTDQPEAGILIASGGTTVRNAVVISPDAPPGTSTGNRNGLVDVETSGNLAADNYSVRSEVYSITYVDMRSDANQRSRSGTYRPFNPGNLDEFGANGYLGNNTHFTPNAVQDPAPDNATNLDEASRWTPIYDGMHWEDEPFDPAYATPPAATASFRPLTGSSEIGAAVGKVSLLDIDGNLRSAQIPAGRSAASKGAYEPALVS